MWFLRRLFSGPDLIRVSGGTSSGLLGGRLRL